MSNDAEDRILRKSYSEIINGFSVNKYKSKNIYVKHFCSLDNLEVDYLYTENLNHAVSKGYPSESDRLDLLEKDGLWSLKMDSEIKSIRESINELFESKRKAFKLRDINFINSQIAKQQSILLDKISIKNKLIGPTAERFAKRSVDSYFVSKSFFKDRGLNNLLFSKEEFDELDSFELDELFSIYYDCVGNLEDDSIKKIALSHFFLNVFHLAENVYQFFGKPISSLTFYQVQLCAYGNFFKTILNSDPKPPEEITNNPEKLEDWYFGRRNAEEALQKVRDDTGDNGATLVGLTYEDRKFLGYDEPPQKAIKKARENGGEISFEEIMKMDGF